MICHSLIFLLCFLFTIFLLSSFLNWKILYTFQSFTVFPDQSNLILKQFNELSWYSSVGRVSAWSHTVRQQQHKKSQFQNPPIPTCRYVEENGLATILVAKTLLGVASKVNQRKCVICMPPPSVNKGDAHSVFETWRRHHHKSKTGVSVAPSNNILKKIN